MDELLQEFVAETRETLDALAGEVVAWEADPTDRTRLDAIFRFVHTVKGSCGFLDLPRLARLSHAAEDALHQVRDLGRVPDARLVDAVLAIVDRIGEIVEAIDAGTALDDTGEELLIAALDGDAAPASGPVVAVPAAPRAPSRSVRLSVDLLDRMMSGMSDMVLARNELARRLRDGRADPAAEAALERLSLTVADMRDAVTRTRMQAIDGLFAALPRLVRDTAGSLDKQVHLTITGADVELDREMVEMMRDPLVHIVRNAIDHGIEPGAERVAAGKPAAGRMTVAASQSGNTIIVEISDDGRGIDTDALVAKLVAGGGDPAVFARMSARDRAALVFAPGLSSRDEVTALSGRGVGMDVVRANIEQIGGRIDLDNRPGQGLTISIQVPLTLSILPTIVVGAGRQRFAIARQAIEEIVTTSGEGVRIDQLGAGRIATVRGRRLPYIDLPRLLGFAETAERPLLVILRAGAGSIALATDAVFDSEELVIRPAAPAVMASGLYAGQTLPDTGLPMLVLDASGIAAAAGVDLRREQPAPAEPATAVEAGPPVLSFTDRDGVRRAVPLAGVDRIEQVPAEAIVLMGGRYRLATDDRLIPVVLQAGLDKDPWVSLIRLNDGTRELAYAVRHCSGISRLDAPPAPAPGDGPIAAAAMLDGDPVELIDTHWLFASVAEENAAERPLCLIADRDGWLGSFVAPLLERAGYRVATSAAAGERPVAILALDDDPVVDPDGANVVRLTAERGGPGIYRYDRAALLAALAEAAA